MKKNTGNKIILGIFVSIGIVLFIAGIYFIGDQKKLFSNTFEIKGLFKNVNGLKVGNNVQFSGISVGTVSTIEIISDTSVSVRMTIEENTRKFIKKNAIAVIGSEGLMGNKIINLLPGTTDKKTIENNDVIKTAVPVSMDDILLKIKVTADNAAIITDDLSAIMNHIREGKGTVGKLFMDSTFAQNIDDAITNIKQGAGGFKQNMNAASQNVLLRGYFKKKSAPMKKNK